MACRAVLEWITMSGSVPVSWITLGYLLHSGNSAEKVPIVTHLVSFFSEYLCKQLFHCDTRISCLSDVNTNSLAFGWTGTHFASYTAAASSCNTLLCPQMYLPWLRATLQELRTNSVVCLSCHSGHVGSSFIPDCTRFTFEGKRSYIARIRKVILSGANCRISFHVRDVCNALSQLVQCPC
ncbi:hypothetical protein PoB_004191300 [Plakobranchus ocellatus]|uniref:Secreted protein n=1 Tax=Plakobranchus ocellatus TaxID=259542 RepID=A0AAV4B8B9_9GAST|nr:hypothetical protein PoB_004191300 [Plakobranchus ocellatus]